MKWIVLALMIFIPTHLTVWLTIWYRSGRINQFRGDGFFYRDKEPDQYWGFMALYAMMAMFFFLADAYVLLAMAGMIRVR